MSARHAILAPVAGGVLPSSGGPARASPESETASRWRAEAGDGLTANDVATTLCPRRRRASKTGAAGPFHGSFPIHLLNLIAANGSVEVGHETAVVLAGDATELLSEEIANRLEGIGVPPARELLAKLLEHAVPVYV